MYIVCNDLSRFIYLASEPRLSPFPGGFIRRYCEPMREQGSCGAKAKSGDLLSSVSDIIREAKIRIIIYVKFVKWKNNKKSVIETQETTIKSVFLKLSS